MSREVGIHLLQWRIQDIIPQLKRIQECGYTFFQISPIQPCKEGEEWWKLYQPFSYSIGNHLGNKEDLINLCKEAKKYNIKVIVDAVLNHMASADTGEIKPHEKVDKRLTSNYEFWSPCDSIKNWDSRYEVITKCDGLPTLKLERFDLQNLIIKFLNEVIDCGVQGLRFDSGKSIALPEENSNFWIRVLDNLHNKENLFNYAEIIFADKELLDKYNKYINVVTNSWSSNKNRMVTYVESHDSF
jgi:alpha-amylase